MAIRRSGLPTPTLDPGQNREMMRTVKETLEVAQRQRGDPMQSFARLEELVQAGVADQYGNIVPVPQAVRRARVIAMFRGT